MLSQNTGIAPADLYAAFFGIDSGSAFLQRQLRDGKLSDFLYGPGFHDDWRQSALSETSSSEVKEFILGFFSGRSLQEEEETLTCL